MPKLDGKVSLVTGGTSGIGLAAANALAKEGAHVYITGRREPELRTAVQQIGRTATGVRGDVSSFSRCEAAQFFVSCSLRHIGQAQQLRTHSGTQTTHPNCAEFRHPQLGIARADFTP